MGRIFVIVISSILIAVLVILVVKYKAKSDFLNDKLEKKSYLIERESVLKEKYFNAIKFNPIHNKEIINDRLVLIDKVNLNKYSFYNFVNSNDLVLSIPEYSCHD